MKGGIGGKDDKEDTGRVNNRANGATTVGGSVERNGNPRRGRMDPASKKSRPKLSLTSNKRSGQSQISSILVFVLRRDRRTCSCPLLSATNTERTICGYALVAAHWKKSSPYVSGKKESCTLISEISARATSPLNSSEKRLVAS